MHNVDLDIIIKYLSGKAMPEEAMNIDQWIQEHPANRTYFEELKKAYFENDGIPEVNMDAAWAQFAQKVNLNHASTPLKIKKGFRLKYFIAAAAGIAAICFSIYFIKHNTATSYYYSAADIAKQAILQDSTKVVLMPKANLELHLSAKERTLLLNGDADIDIRQPLPKLRMHLPHGLMLEDIGTAFLVRQQDTLIQIFVTAGAVRVWDAQASHEITAGDMLTYYPINKQFSKSIIVHNIHFIDESLPTIASEIERLYGTTMTIPSHLQEERLTIKADSIDINALLSIIENTLEIHLLKNNHHVEVK